MNNNFRPLSGSYISQSFLKSCINSSIMDFRPLSGSYISQSHPAGCPAFGISISVPYRGATFLNVIIIFIHHLLCNFRPLSGSYISQFTVPAVNFFSLKFPSPIGELHFSIPSPQPHVLSGTNRGIAGEK